MADDRQVGLEKDEGAPIRVWDTHAHLVDDGFRSDLPEVVERARSEGVEGIVVVGYTVETSVRAYEIAVRYGLRATAGLHPNYLNEADTRQWGRIVELLERRECVAVGETGMDGYRKEVPMDVQRAWFLRHIELAAKLELPVVVHSRDAGGEVIDCLEEGFERFGRCKVVMHAFGEDESVLRRALELGAYISFAGNITYRNRKFDRLRGLVACVPTDRLLVETDSPFLAPEPHRRKRNEPAFVRFVLQRAAELRGESERTLGECVCRNAAAVFGRCP